VSLPGRGETVSCSVGDFLDLDRCQVVDGFVGSFGVEPGDPVQRVEFDVFKVAPGSFGADEFGLVDPDLDSARALS
jgi:hypothetical protein